MKKNLSFLLLCFIFIFYISNGFSQKLEGIKYIPKNFNENFCLISTNCKTIKEASILNEWIGQLGGRIAVIGTPELLLGWINPRYEKKILQNNKIKGIERTPRILTTEGPDEQAVVNYFNSVINGDQAKEDVKNRNISGKFDSLGCLKYKPGSLNPSNRNSGNLDINPMSICQEDKNSEYMMGTVSCGVFFVESNGSIDANTYTWTPAAILDMKTQIIDAYSIWSYTASQNGKSVSFTPVWYTSANIVGEPYEPITHPSTDDYLYIDYIMNNLGYNLGNKFLNTSAFNSDLKATNGTNWAYSAFVVYNPSPAADLMTDSKGSYAYFGGPYMHVLYRYFGWLSFQFFRTFGHETSHIFHAFDEYASAGNAVCNYSFNGVPNSNFHGSTCNGAANCIMVDNSFTGTGASRKWNLCSPTISHIGWQNLTPPPLSLIPADKSNELPGIISFNWDRNTSNTSINSVLRILDSTNTVVYCQDLGSLNSANINLLDGKYTWHVLNAIYPTTGGYAEVSSVMQSLKVGCFSAKISSISKDSTIHSGQGASFSVQAVGIGVLNYQWQVNAGSGWTDISVAGSNPVYSNFNSDTLNLNNAVEANDGNLYRCIVYDSCDGIADTSIAAKLSVCGTLGTAAIIGNNSSCEGNVEYFSASCSGAKSFAWSVPIGCTIDSGQGTANIKVSIGKTSGQVCVIPSNACLSGNMECVNFSANAKPSVVVTASGPLSFCTGDSVIFTASSAFSYAWSNGSVDSSVSIKTAGNYSVIITDLNSCKDTSSIKSVNLFSPIASITLVGNGDICQGNSTILVASKANTYLWSNNATSRSITVSKTGSYTVQIVDSNSCNKLSSATDIHVYKPFAQTYSINGPSSSCNGNIANYFISPLTNAITYAWTGPNGSTINSGQGTNMINLSFGSSAGSVCVVATNVCNSSAPSCKNVNIGNPVSPGSISGPSNFCSSGMNNLAYSVAAVSGSVSYLWTVSSGDSVVSGNGNRSMLASFKNSNSTVCVKTSNSCGVSSPSCLSVGSTPMASTNNIIGSSNVCFAGTTDVNYSLTTLTGISSFLWTPPTGASVTKGQGSSVVNISYGSGFSSGLLCVKSNNLCNLPSTDICKMISETPIIYKDINGQIVVSPGTSNLTYYISIPPGATSYIWTVPSGVSIGSGQGSNSVILNFSGAFSGGTVCVRALNACGSSAYKCLQVNTQ